jgi:hypothetical protein
MAVEESLNKLSYKITIVAIKVIPILIATLFFIRTVLYCLQIDATFLSYICGMSLLPLLFLYLVSYTFRFCAYHRMFLHYIVVVEALNYIDYYIGIPLSYSGLLRVHLIIAIIFMFIILYLHQKCLQKNT